MLLRDDTTNPDQESERACPEVSLTQRRASARRTAYLAQAYVCQDMAQSAEDARDRGVLHAMTVLWQTLAQQAWAEQFPRSSRLQR